MQQLSLCGDWRARSEDQMALEHLKGEFTCTLPGDIHSALIKEKIIPDPYAGDNETEIQWVGKCDWILERTFTVTKAQLKSTAFFQMSMADTIIDVAINGSEVVKADNAFRLWRCDVSNCLREGENTISLHFHSAEAEAIRLSSSLPYPIPYSTYQISSPHRNLIRKTQCHSGWDWGPCIMAFGVYDDIRIDFVKRGKITSFSPIPQKKEGFWDLFYEFTYDAIEEGEEEFTFSLAGSKIKETFPVSKGENHLCLVQEIHGARLWYPNGYGEQPLYKATIASSEEKLSKEVGFRTLDVITEEEEGGGLSFKINVNGIDIWAKGANWIPTDALPARQSDSKYAYLLQAMKSANMNLVRVWGGGQYEKDSFYELCDKNGILVWQDMMFACSMYPATESFLKSVKEEVKYQILRLKSHPSIALWCGNNEDVGAIGWYEESRNNRERYLQDYIRLNDETVGECVKQYDPSRLFWPSSPCGGIGSYQDNWHSDNRGDMHYWTVWHEGKDFEAYYEIKPRFVSEFGYQSFPSIHTLKKFIRSDDLNLTSPIMERHQKNDNGNSIIIENITRYFRFPVNLKKLIYLSQLQQMIAIRSAISYYHALKPYNSGTIYWQLNDVYPCASWSSIDSSGRWKLLHYEMLKLYAPISISAYVKEGHYFIHLINDLQESVTDTLGILTYDFDGNLVKEEKREVTLSSDEVITVEEGEAAESDTFKLIRFKDAEETLFFDRYKRLPLKKPKIAISAEEDGDNFTLTLTSEKPAFFVSLEHKQNGFFTENCFTLLPGEEKKVTFSHPAAMERADFLKGLTIMDLYSSSR